MSLTKNNTWDDPELSAHINREHERLLIVARERGATDGISNRPGDSDSLHLFIGFLTEGYNPLISTIQQELAPALQMALGAGEMKERSSGDLQGRKKIAKIQSRIEQEPKPTAEQTALFGPLTRLLIGIISLILIVASDWRYLAASLENIGGSNLSSSIIALGIAISTAVAVHALIVMIPRIASDLWRKLSWGGSLLFFTLVFWTLAYLRVHMVGAYDSGNPVFFMLAFIFFNFLFLAAAYFIGTKFLVPGFAKLVEVWKERKQQQKIQDLHAEIEAIEAEMKSRENRLRSSLTDKMKIHEYTRSLEKTVNSYYRIAVGEYFRNNIDNRLGPTPQCFNSPLPELERIDYKFQSNENDHE